MQKLSPFDLKHILLMHEIIDLYQENRISLFQLVGDLQAVLDILETISKEDEAQIGILVNTVELIHDSEVDGSLLRWKEDPKKVLESSLEDLKAYSKQILKDYVASSDPNVTDVAVLLDLHWLMCPKCDEAWESISSNPMLICPKCKSPLHNPFLDQQPIHE